jgi:hypothetical protein
MLAESRQLAAAPLPLAAALALSKCDCPHRTVQSCAAPPGFHACHSPRAYVLPCHWSPRCGSITERPDKAPSDNGILTCSHPVQRIPQRVLLASPTPG